MLVWKTWLLLILTNLYWSCCQATGPRCDYDQFQCKSGACIDEFYRCDGEKDCDDFSDEANCKAEYQAKCGGSDHFVCDGECRPTWIRCNGFIDCNDELDEAFCDEPLTEATPISENRELNDMSTSEVSPQEDITEQADDTKPFEDLTTNNYGDTELFEYGVEPEKDPTHTRPEEVEEEDRRPSSDSPPHQEIEKVSTYDPAREEILQIYNSLNTTPPTELAVGQRTDDESSDQEEDRWGATDGPSMQTNIHFEVIEENLINSILPEDDEHQTTESAPTKQYREWELYTQPPVNKGMETLFSLLRHTPQSAIKTLSSTLPKPLAVKAKEILRQDPEALVAILDQLGEEVPASQDKPGLALLNYTRQEFSGEWIALASNPNRMKNDTLLQSALEIIYSLWEVVKDSSLHITPNSDPPNDGKGTQDVIAALFKLFEEETANKALTSSTTEKSTTERSYYDDNYTLVQNLLEVQDLSTTNSYAAKEKNVQTNSEEPTTPSAAIGDELTTDAAEPQVSTLATDCAAGAECTAAEDKDESEEDNGADVTPLPEELDDNETEDPDARTVDELNGQEDIANETSSAPPLQSPATSTPNPEPCLGPGPVLHTADHHFCFKSKPYRPISAYIKLYPNSDIDSFHVYLVALQLTGGDMAIIRMNPVLLRKLGTEKIAEMVKIATQMSIPLLFEVDMIDMGKIHEPLLSLSQTIRKQNSLILGWHFQINNKTLWITNKYGVARNLCVNDTVNMQFIRKFREETKALGHLLSITVTEDEPDLPTNNTAKKVVRRKCDYNPELWIDLTVELSDFQIFDPNGSSALTPILTINKHVPLLLRSAQVPVGEKHSGKKPGEFGYGGFIVNGESTVASFLMLRKFRNFIPAV